MNWNWSLKVGRMFGIDIRLHWTLLIYFAAGLLGAGAEGGFTSSLVQFLILFTIILLHEFGHCFAARSVGGGADQVVLWILGGLAYVDAPNRPRAQFWTALGGPLVNVAIAAGMLVAGYFQAGERVLDFLTGAGQYYTYAQWLWPVIFLTNLNLLVFNLIPAFPMDMGRVLQCALWPRLGFGRATLIAVNVGKTFAVLMGIYALALSGGAHGRGLHALALATDQFFLVILAVWLFMQCEATRQMLLSGELQEDSIFAESAMMRVEDPDVEEFRRSRRGGWFGGLRRWWRERRAAREQQEAAEDRRPPPDLDPGDQARVDSLLAKISREGIGSLSGEERQFLDATSRRLRGGG